MKLSDQSGFGVILSMLVIVVVGLASLTAVTVFRARVSTQTLKGTITTQNCPSSSNNCHEQSLSATNGQSYGLTGLDASTYDQQKVVVKGTVSSDSPTPVVKVKTIQPDTQSPEPPPAPAPPPPPPPSSSFNGEQFYNQVQIGMSYDQVVSLAGNQAGNCEYSGAPPPSDYQICTWQDTITTITVSFSSQKVNHKSKQSS